MSEADIRQAIQLMERHAERTGLTGGDLERRYLWTDAFAVGNLLALARATGDQRYRRLAMTLVDAVHAILGRHRADAPESGWLSGLTGADAADHPTRGGLRIGKPLAERSAGQPYDPQLEWQRDGQYFHYLTRWMHALDLVARDRQDARFNRWGRELAAAAHAAFLVPSPVDGPPRMVWKMSIDLQRPLVTSMGQHDPLDGYVTALTLISTARHLDATDDPDLADEVASFAHMVEGLDWGTTDPLGLGGLLVDALEVDRCTRDELIDGADLLASLLGAARDGLDRFAKSGELARPAVERLAFRELGLAIGLAAASELERRWRSATKPSNRPAAVLRQIEALERHLPLGGEIVEFWRSPVHRQATTWTDHLDISEVMLATALVPAGHLGLDAT